jgi:hypothetical protein
LAGVELSLRDRTWLRMIVKPAWQIENARTTPNPSAAIEAEISTKVFKKSCIMASKAQLAILIRHHNGVIFLG